MAIPHQMPVAKLKEKNKMPLKKQRKPNILTLNQKVSAIRRYEVDPSFMSVGRHFNCCPNQIKRIIMQKAEILKEWDKTKQSRVNLTREVQMSFLEKAMHEWVRRMMYYPDFNLADALIQTMAFEFRNALYLPNFVPDKSWVASFRNAYNLKEVSSKTLGTACQEGLSVQIPDILRYLHSVDTCGSSEGAIATRVSEVNSTDVPALSAEHKDSKSPPRNATATCAPSTSTAALSERSNTTPASSTKQTEPPCIKFEPAEDLLEKGAETVDKVITHKEAMHYVKQLEEFALLKENFRLIGLVERLQEALKAES